MKKNTINSIEARNVIRPSAGRCAVPFGKAGRKRIRRISQVITVCSLNMLILFLILGTGLTLSPSVKNTPGTESTAAGPIGQADPFLPGSLGFDDVSPLERSGILLPGRETTSTETGLPAETDPVPTVTAAPTPYPRVTDENGIPQEGMPVEDFIADNTFYYVKGNHTNVRESPATDSDVVTYLRMGDKVTRVGYGLDWSWIRTASGKTGYVLTSLISVQFIPTPTPTPTPKPTPRPKPKPTMTPSPVGSSLTEEQKQAIVDLARSFIGTRYVYGAMSPSDGFDCSGLTSYIYKTLFGVRLPRSASDQAKAGVAVSSKDIEIGDIICFDWSSPRGVCDHVGIYIGGGRYIHASYSSGKVLESTVTFGKTPVVSIRRIIY